MKNKKTIEVSELDEIISDEFIWNAIFEKSAWNKQSESNPRDTLDKRSNREKLRPAFNLGIEYGYKAALEYQLNTITEPIEEDIENEIKRLVEKYWKPEHAGAVRIGFLRGVEWQSNKVTEPIKDEELIDFLSNFNCDYDDESGKFYRGDTVINILKQYAASQVSNSKWEELEKMGTPEKWLKVYERYQELLTKEDVAGFYQEQFNIANEERNKLKSNSAGVFVKASERLPEVNKTVNIKYKGNPNTGHYDGEDFWVHYDYNENKSPLHEEIEWLDESQPNKCRG